MAKLMSLYTLLIIASVIFFSLEPAISIPPTRLEKSDSNVVLFLQVHKLHQVIPNPIFQVLYIGFLNKNNTIVKIWLMLKLSIYNKYFITNFS